MDKAVVNTARVTDRRRVRYENFEQLWADVERIAAAERAGTLRRSGNWTAGQALGHLGAWVNFASEGFPPAIRAPWFIRWIVGIRKRRYLDVALPHGVRIPGIPGGTVGTEEMTLDQGLEVLRTAWQRLLASAPPHPSPLFGRMSQEEWIRLNLRHAELHLSFLHP